MFKKRRGIHIPYNQQGFIYFTCMTVQQQPPEVQRKILNVCISVSGEHYNALYELLTNGNVNVSGVALKYHISESSLYKFRRRFYEEWYKKYNNSMNNIVENAIKECDN